MNYLDDETKKRYTELADAVIRAHEFNQEAETCWEHAEEELINAMIDRELDSLYRAGFLIELCAPEGGDVFLEVLPRPTLDLEL